MVKFKSYLGKIVQYVVIAAVILGLGTAVYISLQDGTTAAMAPVRNGKSDAVCIMFNVYQNTEQVYEAVRILGEYGVNATFFLGGSWVSKNQECTNYIYKSGNEIGSHGYSHYDHSRLDYAKNLAEIEKSINIIEKVCTANVKLFAPPSGAYNRDTLSACKALNLEVILWSKDTIDWRDQNKQIIISRALDGLKGGDFILMHPTVCTIQALPEIIEGIFAAGMRPCTVGNSTGTTDSAGDILI